MVHVALSHTTTSVKTRSIRGRHLIAQAGFTLAEMIVVTGIIALISGIVLANNNRFGGKILLQNLSYDIALSIRQAQISGISVQRFKTSFGAAYGMHFVPTTGLNTDSFQLFADLNESGTYDSATELVQSTTIAGGYRILRLCAKPPGQADICNLATLDIAFKRPESDARILSPAYAGLNESASIRVSSPRDDYQDITVDANGQISVKAVSQ